MSRRTSRSMLAVLIVALTAGLAACGGSSSPSAAGSTEASAPAPASSGPAESAAAGPAVDITFWSWAPDITSAVDAYNASQSAIHVTLDNTNAGNAEYAALNTALSTGTGVPDA